ncbi:uncharacterized protein LOC130210164 [Pseudoliparis swirei]|uniref:uncharacterized protein LOC130210164 n=1 Tax=Pseudoliparis swirei TaxID=2059687 RepID=UPI0024BE4147|nr:uncharacterized protein LOC130210164 [Pseudoliparis swirei]
MKPNAILQLSALPVCDAPLAGGGVARVSCVAAAEEQAERHRNREQLTRSPEAFKIRQQQSSGWLNPPYNDRENKECYSCKQPGVSLVCVVACVAEGSLTLWVSAHLIRGSQSRCAGPGKSDGEAFGSPLTSSTASATFADAAPLLLYGGSSLVRAAGSLPPPTLQVECLECPTDRRLLAGSAERCHSIWATAVLPRIVLTTAVALLSVHKRYLRQSNCVGCGWSRPDRAPGRANTVPLRRHLAPFECSQTKVAGVALL